MRLETRRRNIEKSVLDSFKETRLGSQTSQDDYNRLKELQRAKEFLEQIPEEPEEEPPFEEQEAGKATIKISTEAKMDMEAQTALIEEELSRQSDKMLKRFGDLFSR